MATVSGEVAMVAGIRRWLEGWDTEAASRWFRRSTLLALGFGWTVAIAYYLNFRALWLDEASVAWTLVLQPFRKLFFGTLDQSQQFPRVYLAAIYLFQKLVGYELWSIRLFPLLFGLAGMGLWYRLYLRDWSRAGARAAVWTSVFLFFTNHYVYEFAGDLKQYSGDLFFCGFVFWWFQIRLAPKLGGDWGPWLRGALVASVPILFSYPYAMALIPAAVVTGIPRLREIGSRKAWAQVVALVLIALPFAGFVYEADVKHSLSGNANFEWWKSTFLGNPFADPVLFVAKFRQKVAYVIGRWWVEPLTDVFAVLGLLGIWGAWRTRSPGTLHFLARYGSVFLAVLIALAMRNAYPLEWGRSSIGFFPFAVAMIACGGMTLRGWLPERWGSLAPISIAIGAAVLAFAWKLPKLGYNYSTGVHWENIRPAVERMDPNEAKLVFLDFAAQQQVLTYPHFPEAFERIVQVSHDYSEKAPYAAKLTGPFYILVGYAVPETRLEFIAFANRIAPHECRLLVGKNVNDSATLHLCVPVGKTGVANSEATR